MDPYRQNWHREFSQLMLGIGCCGDMVGGQSSNKRAENGLEWQVFGSRRGFQKLNALISLIKDDNDASIAVAKRLGAIPDGRFKHTRLGETTVYRHFSD